MNRMLKFLLIPISALVLFFGFSSNQSNHLLEELGIAGDSLKVLKPKDQYRSEVLVINGLLKRYHYNKVSLTDSVSSVIFDNYFESIDPAKAYFLKSDVEKFERYRNELDDQLMQSETQFAYDVFSLYRGRALNRIDFVFQLLEKGFDFSKKEKYKYDRDEANWCSSVEDQDELWRKIIKNQALSYYLTGKEWKEIKESLEKRYKRIQKAIYQYKSEDVFQSYMNAYTSAFDPHTNYFSPPDAENFNINMSLSLEGIGAQLTQNLDYTQIVEIIPGGPAYKSKELAKDDKIIGVAQGEDGKFEDIIGWRLDDAVSKIRGPKGSVVKLLILKASKGDNALPDTIRLVRDKINLENQSSKGRLIDFDYGKKKIKLGVITVPSFYLDFDAMNRKEANYRSTTRDVKKLIDSLKNKGMEGLMIDLRHNGGGSLQEAIEMTGLFIPQGPVVQVRNSNQSVDVMNDKDKGTVYYDGPLTVLVNRGSASASEIFSGAIQDYKRGVIIGEGTFGKGTVQNIIGLSDFIKNSGMKLGNVKMTLAKFYRVTGSSNQRVGITPDVQFPSFYSLKEYGEARRPNALPWDKIQQAGNFKPTNQISDKLIDKLNTQYRKELKTDKELIKIVKKIEKAKTERKKKEVSLNLAERKEKQEKDKNKEDAKKPENTKLSDKEKGKTRKSDNKVDASKDPYLNTGLKLLSIVIEKK